MIIITKKPVFVMVTVSHIVQKVINEKIFILEVMNRGLISYGSLAIQLKPEIEKELGKEVKTHAIVMALRRHAEQLKKKRETISFNYYSEIILKTDICDISVRRSLTLFNKLKKLYDMVNFENGDILNIIHGRCEVSIITNERYWGKMFELLKVEKVLNVKKNLLSLTLTFPQDYVYAPRVMFKILRNFAWENINIFEIVSTDTELTFILDKNDEIKAYIVLGKLVRS